MSNTVSILDGYTCVGSFDAASQTYVTDLSDLMLTRGFAVSKLIKNYDNSGILQLLAPNKDIDWAYVRKHQEYRHISKIEAVKSRIPHFNFYDRHY